jgi:hypothetical protein
VLVVIIALSLFSDTAQGVGTIDVGTTPVSSGSVSGGSGISGGGHTTQRREPVAREPEEDENVCDTIILHSSMFSHSPNFVQLRQECKRGSRSATWTIRNGIRFVAPDGCVLSCPRQNTTSCRRRSSCTAASHCFGVMWQAQRAPHCGLRVRSRTRNGLGILPMRSCRATR